MAAPLPSIAVPGQRLGPASSYIPGPGTHIQDSFVCASIAGPVILQGEELSRQQQQQKKQQKKLITIARSFAQTLKQQQQQQQQQQHQQSQKPASTPTTTTTTTTKPPKYKYNTLPAVDSVVLARVTRVQRRQATLSILVVLDDHHHHNNNPNTLNPNHPTTTPPASLSTTNADPLNDPSLRFQALLRREDVRSVEKDRVVMDEMFRVGDIVRAVVISLGDQGFYYCSTARNELGVVMGRSEKGNVLVPVSWREMVDVGGDGEGLEGVGVGDAEGGKGRREARKVARPF
ncbi:hypothetical protein AJ79_07388 [Helicocarpus griseus UAMH5409]|uniref:Exosome complex component CSL4 C-terminal domain-containing protein n=1 Tax=Helicocarpus griseus UAMH5409 TaxID=1447875 RepID=A0A2B7X3V6_9EURO|nr:hypothetical protein AJ79_07388 [Helicocarpus griseus UAMH5409]